MLALPYRARRVAVLFSSAFLATAAAAEVTREQARPPTSLLVGCEAAPPSAVRNVPPEIKRWATIYCTRNGQLFSANDGYMAMFPGSGVRGAVFAAEFSGRTGPAAGAAHFTRISISRPDDREVDGFASDADAVTREIVKGDKLRIDLTVDTGQVVSMLAVDLENDPFWVLPITGGRFSRFGFYVISLDKFNRKR